MCGVNSRREKNASTLTRSRPRTATAAPVVTVTASSIPASMGATSA